MTTKHPAGPRVDGWHRYWWGDDGPYLSVTTATSVIDKPGVNQWRVNETAKYAIEHARELAEMTPEQAYREIRSATEGLRVDSADFGTAVHDLIHQFVSGNPNPVVVVGSDEERFLWAYAVFKDDYKLGTPYASELAVFNDDNMTAGRIDQIYYATPRLAAELHVDVDDLVAVDNKTGKAAYGETELQLAGYDQMHYFGRPGDAEKFKLPRVKAHAVLHVRPHQYEGGHPSGYELIPYHVTQTSVDLFRAAVLLRRWQQDQDRKYRASKKDAA